MPYSKGVPYVLLAFSTYWLWFGFRMMGLADDRLAMRLGYRWHWSMSRHAPLPLRNAWDTYAVCNGVGGYGMFLAGIAVWLIREPQVLLGRCDRHRSAFLVIGVFTLHGVFTPLSPVACAVLLALATVVASWEDPTELEPNTDPAVYKYSLWFRKAAMKLCRLHRRIRIGLLFGFLLIRVALALSVIQPPSDYTLITTTFDLSLVAFILLWCADERDLRLSVNR